MNDASFTLWNVSRKTGSSGALTAPLEAARCGKEKAGMGMTLTPPQMREEAARSAFAGLLDKKSCRASDGCSMERRRVVRRFDAGAFRRSERRKSEAHPI